MNDLVEAMARAANAKMRAEQKAKFSSPDAVSLPFDNLDHTWQAILLACQAAAITALEQSGFRVVPVEPTEAMQEAAATATDAISYHMSGYHCAGEAWKAMLAAAPKVTP